MQVKKIIIQALLVGLAMAESESIDWTSDCTHQALADIWSDVSFSLQLELSETHTATVQEHMDEILTLIPGFWLPELPNMAVFDKLVELTGENFINRSIGSLIRNYWSSHICTATMTTDSTTTTNTATTIDSTTTDEPVITDPTLTDDTTTADYSTTTDDDDTTLNTYSTKTTTLEIYSTTQTNQYIVTVYVPGGKCPAPQTTVLSTHPPLGTLF